MKKKRFPLFIVFISIVLCVLGTGCGSKRSPQDQTTFQLHEDGSITHTIIDSYTDSFSEEELNGYIQEQLSDYVKNSESPEVTLESCAIDEGSSKVTIEMKYASIKDYASFNKVTAFNGWIQDAFSKGYDFSNGFVTDKGTYLQGYLLPVEYPDLSVVVLQEPMKVILPDSVILTSDNITKNEDGSYSILKDAVEGVPEIFQTVNGSFAYLVYVEKG